MKTDFENALQQEPVQAILATIMMYTTESQRQIIYEKLGRRLAPPLTSPGIVAEAALLYPTCNESAPSLNERQMARRAAHISCAESYQSRVKELEGALQDLVDAVPKQTEDADWWEDSLTDAMKKANEILNK